jgi:hypothetical protein
MFSRAGRKRPTTRRVVDPEAPDTMFPHLARWRADLIREEAMRTLHAEGFDTSWSPDGGIRATPADARQHRLIRLDGLAHRIASAPYIPSPDVTALVRDFVAALLTEVDAENVAEAITEAEFLRRLRVRLVSQDTLDATPGTVADASRDFTGDLRASLALDPADGSGTVTTLNDLALAAHGTATADQLGDLYRVGYRNTWQDLDDATVEVATVDEMAEFAEPAGSTGATAAGLHVIESDCPYLASALLFLDDLLPRWLPGVDTSAGVIVAVPHPRLLLVSEVATGQDLVDGINTMTTVALTELMSAPDPLTARLHLAYDGDVHAFTDVTTDEEGQQILQVDPDNYLLSRLEGGN